MNITLKATGFETTPSITDYVNRKISTLEKFFGDKADSVLVRVEVGKTTDHHKHGDVFRAEVHISGLRGQDIYVAEETADLYASIDKVRDEAERRLTHAKDRKMSLMRRGGARIKNMIRGMFGSEE